MTGELFINGQDAFTNWGLSLGEGAFSSLVCPAPAKDYVVNDMRTRTGKSYAYEYAQLNARTVSLVVYIHANDRADMYAKLADFALNVLAHGKIELQTSYQQNVKYRFVYKQCQQMSEMNGRLGRFMLTVDEPNPEDRGL